MKLHTITELNQIYDEADTVDKEQFAEFRSNVLLAAGEHYSRQGEGRRNTRDPRAQHESQRLRIVKNHIHRVVRKYKAAVLSFAPGITVVPANETDLQDQKEAELNLAVYQWAKARHRIREKIRQWADDFVKVGEVCVVLKWDPTKGDLKGYEQKLDEGGQPLFEDGGFDEMGLPIQTPVADETRPVYSGDFVFERTFAANLLRHVSADSMRESECLVVRKMVAISKLKARYKDDEDKLKGITSSADDTYIVFDSAKSSYEKAKDQACVREYYFRPCPQYPEGYFYITTSGTILEEGPLPFGIFPVIWAGMDESQGTPRAKSVLKVARPVVAEINRASSQQALQQITLGDDKVLYQKGSKLEPGALLPGVRGISFSGREPKVLPGRDGGQFSAYIANCEAELDRLLMLGEIDSEKATQMDPVALLFRAANQTMKYSEYAETFEQFLVDLFEVFFQLAQHYLPNDMLIPAVGKREQVNIEEFRRTSPLHFRVRVEPQSETIESKLGKQLQFQHILQYVGKQLNKDDIGKLLKEMPYGNFKEAFDDFTLDTENAKNDMLALDRGQLPPLSTKDDPAYMLKKISHRMRKSDFQFLAPEVQQAYQQREQQYIQLEAEQMQKMKAAQSEFIPIDGALVKCDIYVGDPKNPEAAPKRATVPQRALEWLLEQLESQGASMEKLEQMNQGTLAQLAEQFLGQQQQQFQPPQVMAS